jgi:predicted N-acetyltransferase YhbS
MAVSAMRRPDHQHRGLFRDALERAMTFASTRFEALMLTTLHREYFEPFGFRVVPESIFRPQRCGDRCSR